MHREHPAARGAFSRNGNGHHPAHEFLVVDPDTASRCASVSVREVIFFNVSRASIARFCAVALVRRFRFG